MCNGDKGLDVNMKTIKSRLKALEQGVGELSKFRTQQKPESTP
jgi:hypothetical protein